MTKHIIRDPEVMNIITSHLTNTQNSYNIGNCEWSDGSRSDVVLEPKSSALNLPPLIIELQHDVNVDFMRRAIGRCLQASRRYSCGPILLIICMASLSSGIVDGNHIVSERTACFNVPCSFWAKECLIACKESVRDCDARPPLDQFAALVLFLTHGAQSLVNAPCNEDVTMKHLFTLAINHYKSVLGNEKHLIDTLNETIEIQSQEYTRLRGLLANEASADVLDKAIQNAQTRNHKLKRKYSGLGYNHPSPINAPEEQASSSFDVSASNGPNSAFIAGMEFVKRFKKKRENEGKRMSWVECLSEGKEAKILGYKNPDSLRTRFNKYINKQGSITIANNRR